MAKRQSNQMSRAEKLRTRRQQSQRESPIKPVGSSATRKPKQRVPVTRRNAPNTPIVNRKRGKMHVPLKTKGAEVQLPALPRLKFGWRLISGGIFLLSLAIVISFIGLSAFEISTINLEGVQRLSTEEILYQSDMIGKSIISVKPEEIETKIIESFPSLKNVRAYVGLPAEVQIKAEEREPIVLWQQSDNALWIDQEGFMFPVRGEAEVPVTVVANGDPPVSSLSETTEPEEQADEVQIAFIDQVTYPKTTPEFVLGILSISQYVPESTTVQYDPQFGLGWQDPQGWIIYFGKDTNDIDIKLAGYQTIIEAIQKNNITPTLISLEFLDAPYYRMEQ